MSSLWGEEFDIPEVDEHKILSAINSPKAIKSTKKISSKISLEDRMSIVKSEVERILGVYAENTIVITTKEQFVAYIDKAIENGIIAIDTETNRSIDPLTCKLMGPCIYTPGEKNAYIPINHVDINTNKRLDWQLTESDCKEQFDRLKDTKIIMHNGKFDYQVIKCTCDCILDIYWDTMIGSQLLDENERAGLKFQYISKIDSSIEKYDIENLFDGIDYELYDPELFALYAATDAFMTYKLYLWQKEQFEKPGCEKLFNLFNTIEMPMVIVAAEMELNGVTIDSEYADRLSKKYHNKLAKADIEIATELNHIKPLIDKWRKTKDANYHPPKKSGDGDGKSKNEQLADPVEVTSPTQLAILIYDVLGYSSVDKKTPRGTGEDILKKLSEKYPEFKLGKLILEKRGVEKLLGTYIDKLPACVNAKDNKLHAHFNQMGTEDKAVRTGRMSSTDPKLLELGS